MYTIFMNSRDSKTSDPHRLLLSLSDKINWSDKWSDKYVALSDLKVKISAPTWNEEFELPDGSYSVSDIPEYFEYVLKNMEKGLIILKIL